MRRFLMLCTLFAISSPGTAKASGKIVLANDEWTLSNDQFNSPSTAQFVNNVASYFTDGQTGEFHAYSTNFGLGGHRLRSAMETAGHTWSVGTDIPFNLPTLLNYDGIFLAGDPANNQVLIDYVEAGGNVYLAGGTGVGGAVGEAAAWRPFLNRFGLGLAETYNNVDGFIPIGSQHPIFAGVEQLYQDGGNDIYDYEPDNEQNQILAYAEGHALYAVYDGSDDIQPLQKVYLDWDRQISRQFYVGNTPEFGEDAFVQTLLETPGVTPRVPASDSPLEFREAVLNHVRAIYDTAQIPIDIELAAPLTLDESGLQVRFSSLHASLDHDGNSTTSNGVVLGNAWDIIPTDGSAADPDIDRFNRRSGGEVAIYMNPTTYSIEHIAETVAHEIGHALGLRHIDAGFAEVMSPSYREVIGDIVTFADTVNNIAESCAGPGLCVEEFGTHNPLYHLRRYVGHESHEDLSLDGITPGDWDIEEETDGLHPWRIQGLQALQTVLYDLLIQMDIGGGDWVTIKALDSYDPTYSGPLLFDAPTNLPIRILASSLSGTHKDIYLSATNQATDITLGSLDSTSVEATIFQMDFSSGEATAIGNVIGTLIPEPSTCSLLLACISCLGLRCRRATINLTVAKRRTSKPQVRRFPVCFYYRVGYGN